MSNRKAKPQTYQQLQDKAEQMANKAVSTASKTRSNPARPGQFEIDPQDLASDLLHESLMQQPEND